jgi:hypothetical protein
MRALAPILVLLVLLCGCSRLGALAPGGEPGIAGRTVIVPEERSTCEALRRADLAVVATDPVSLDRSAASLEDASARAPGDVRPALDELAGVYRKASPDDAAGLAVAPAAEAVVTLFNVHCGGVR